jgi:hypothetical protein
MHAPEYVYDSDLTDPQRIHVMWHVLFGTTDGVTHRHVDGVIDTMATVANKIKMDSRINGWIIRGLFVGFLAHFFGIDNLAQLVRVFGGH